MVAHGILLTSPEAKFLFPFLGTLDWELALGLSTMQDRGLKMVQQVTFIMFSLNMVDYLMSFLLLSRGPLQDFFTLWVGL